MEYMYVERLRPTEGGAWAYASELEQFDVEADFNINIDQVEREMCRTGQLLARYGTVSAEQEANLKRKEENVKYVAAQISAAIRSTAEKAGTKTTEGKISEELTAHPDYQSALSVLHILRADATKTDHWWRAILKRADLLNSLAYRQGAEYKRT